jgi:tRNA-splicing endonuclease subunit Sen34
MRAARRSALAEMTKKDGGENEGGAPGSLFVPDDEDAPLGPAAGSSSSSASAASMMPGPDDRAIPSSSGIAVAAAPTSTIAPAPVVLDSLPPYTVHIPSTSDGLVWYNPAEYDTLSAASAAGIWIYPSTYEERARCVVFRALSEKGYYMGGGIKFGGDWLVYPGSWLFPFSLIAFFCFCFSRFRRLSIDRSVGGGTCANYLYFLHEGDPLRYHSHFVATVYPKPTSSLRPIDIVALGRLGTATKKAHLLCGWDEENDTVDFYSIEWAGFG